VELTRQLRKAEEEREELAEEAAEMGAKARRMEEEMTRKIEETRRKIDGEIGRKAEIEGEAERLRAMQVPPSPSPLFLCVVSRVDFFLLIKKFMFCKTIVYIK
jgi:hypothetical protein